MTESLVEKYTKMREQYLAINSLLIDNRSLFEKIEQNQVEIKEMLRGEWGY